MKKNNSGKFSETFPENKGSWNLPAAKLPSHKDYRDFRSSMPWRVFRIMGEFVEGFEFIADFPKCVTIFGSTRSPEGNKWYEEARKLGKLLAGEGNAVVAGGGPGVMEAANRGVFEGNGDSVGINIKLPEEQRINPYVKRSRAFHYFFTRKVMLTYAAEAYVYFPGGFGTLDEFFEIITLIQTKEISSIPVILFGSEYWKPLTEWIDSQVCKKYKAIDQADTRIYTMVDSAEDALRIIKKAPIREEFYDKAHYDPKTK